MDRRKERKNKLTMKQWICLALVGVMLLGVLPIAAFAADDGIATIANLSAVTVQAGESKGFTLNQSSGNSTITVVAKDSNGEEVEGFSVTRNYMGGRNATLTVSAKVPAGEYNLTISYGNNKDTMKVTVTAAPVNAGTMRHLEVVINTSIVVDGQNVPIVLTPADFRKDGVQIRLTHNNETKVLTMGASAVTVAGVNTTRWTDVSNSLDYDDQNNSTVKLNGYFPTGSIANPVQYTFKIPYTVEIDGKNIEVTLSVTTNYWDTANHCPGLTNKTSWQNGGFSSSSGIDITLNNDEYKSEGDLIIAKTFQGLDGIVADKDYTFHFELYKKSGEKFEYVTDVTHTVEKGASFSEATIVNMNMKVTSGTYYLVEVDIPQTVGAEGMKFKDVLYGNPVTRANETVNGNPAIAVSVNDKQQTQIDVVNVYEPSKGELKLTKVVNGVKATNEQYTFQVKSGANIVATITLKDGETKTVALAAGEYTIEESAKAENIGKYHWTGVTYTGDTEENKVTIAAGQTVSVTATNTYEESKGSLTLVKKIVGATFAEDTSYVFEVVDDQGGKQEYTITVPANASEGSTVLNGLTIGTYTVTEAEASQANIGNYKCADVTYSASSVEVTTTGAATVTVTNTYEAIVGNLTIKKEFSDLPEGVETPAVTVTVTATGDNNYSEEFILNADNNYEVTISNLPAGTYTVTEDTTAADIAEVGYYALDKVEYANDGSVTIGDGKTEVVTVTNTYKKAYTDVTIVKEVTGNMGDRSEEFTFELKVNGEIFGDKFNLKHGQSKTVKKVPVGATLTITEESGNYTATVDNKALADFSVVVADGMSEIVVTNKYEVTIDTGIEMDVMPFVILLAIAGGALVLLNRKRLF